MKEIKKKDEVERFLKQFLPKLDIWGIIYTLGQPNSKTICISFHESEYKIDYAFKNKKGGE